MSDYHNEQKTITHPCRNTGYTGCCFKLVHYILCVMVQILVCISDMMCNYLCKEIKNDINASYI